LADTSTHIFNDALVANGENVKVVQELMRHANSGRTLEVYSQAKIMEKREAQQRIVQMILSEQPSGCEITLLHLGPHERLDSIP